MPVSDFLDLMNNTVQVEPQTGYDGYANRQYGTAVEYRARVSYGRRTAPSPGGGEQLVASGTVWLAGSVPVTPEDRLTLPTGQQPEILSVERPTDETGEVHHTKVTFK